MSMMSHAKPRSSAERVQARPPAEKYPTSERYPFHCMHYATHITQAKSRECEPCRFLELV